MFENPFEVLGLPETATEDEVQVRWREMVMDLHPDLGGSPDKFNHYNQAYQQAREIAHHRDVECAMCHGSERVTRYSGIHRLEIPCPQCQE